MKSKALAEIESELKNLSDKKPKKDPTIGLYRIGLRVPVARKRLKQGYSFSKFPNTKLLEIWDYVWNKSRLFEVKSQALYYYQSKSLEKFEFDKLRSWTNQCFCWEHSDDLSKIYAWVVENNPKWIVPTLKKWNRSKSLWERRQSVVSLLEYASKRKKTLSFNEMIQNVENLFNDDEYYVQKGVGWTLREIYNVFPKKTLKYIEDRLYQISPLAYSAATEKLDKKTKMRINKKRKLEWKRNV